jgi:restriction system protein
MPIPDFESLMLPILRLVADGSEHTVAEIRAKLAEQLKLSGDEQAERYPSGSQAIFPHRIRWALQYLKESGALLSAMRGAYKISDRGLLILAQDPSAITSKTLLQFPEFREFTQKASAPLTEPDPVAGSRDVEQTPEEVLDRAFQEIQAALANNLLEQIKSVTDAAFEQIVVDLMVGMYAESFEDAGRVVGGPGDGGIDGIVKQDKLGLDVIYLQAKKWKGHVGRPEIMQFSGALARKNANRGVFITASGFSSAALEYVEALPQRIALVDGKQLVDLMIQYNVGVTPATPPKDYVVKRLNRDYFDNL